MTVHQRRKLMMVVLAAALVVSAIAASSASAIMKQLPNRRDGVLRAAAQRGRSRGRTRSTRVSVNQDYNGGPVMPSNTDYMLLWSPQGLSAYPNGFVFGIARYFT